MSDFQPTRAASDGRGRPFLALVAVLLVLLGSKLWLIGAYGNATPLLDQWDAEATQLYKPFLEGTLGWDQLLAAHNEHRIFTHRVLALALFVLNESWDPLLQMVVNAAVHVFAIGLAVALLARVVGRAQLLALSVFALVLFVVPYAWENTLGGFHSAFYFVFPFSFAGLWLLVTAPPLSARWWSGVFCALLAFLSLASGLLVPAVAAFTSLAVLVSERRGTRRQWIAIVFLLGLFAVGVALTPRLSTDDATGFKAASFSQFFDAWFAGLSWPIPSSLVSALARNLPALIFGGVLLWNRPAADDRRWFLLALVVWVFGLSASLAYGRAVGNLASRYLDSFAFGILVNFACLISLAQQQVGTRRRSTLLGAGAWVITALISLGLYADKHVSTELSDRRTAQLAHELNTRNYLATDDFDWLNGKPMSQAPHFLPRRLAVLLASPTVRAILPANIRPPMRATSIESEPTDAFVADGYYLTTPKPAGWTLGSYSSRFDAATGRAAIRFDSNQQSLSFAIPVAGYPLNEDISLEIEQDGRRRAVTLEKNPGEKWEKVSVHVDKGPFALILSDMNGKSMGWLAVGAPVAQGNCDAFTQRALASYSLLIMLGLAAGILSVMQYDLSRVGNPGP